MKEAVLEEMRAHFRPEFLNRVDEIIVFHALAEEHLKQIVDIQLDRVSARLADRQIKLDLTDQARSNLVRTGFDPAYGARPLKRAIQKKLETPLGRLLVGGKILDGQTILVDAADDTGELSFHPQRPRGRPHSQPPWSVGGFPPMYSKDGSIGSGVCRGTH